MKKYIYILLIVLLSLSCEKDDVNKFEKNIVSNDKVMFEELLFLLNIKTNDSSYLVVKSIDSINIYVNNTHWTKINSSAIDIDNISKTTIGNTFVSKQKINYLVLATNDKQKIKYNTAGEVAKYLNNVQYLKAGDYVCFIESFQLTLNDNSTKTYYPNIYAPFKIERNFKSSFVGELTVCLDI